jgi:hypothetical protein
MLCSSSFTQKLKCNEGQMMDIVERLRDQFDVYDETKLEAADEIERLRQLVKELNSVAYVIDGHGIAHHSFTIVYKELE